MLTPQQQALDSSLLRIISATHHDPFAVLGRHPLPQPSTQADTLVRVYLPGAQAAWLLIGDAPAPLVRVTGSDFFEWAGLGQALPEHYEIEWHDRS